MGTQQILLIVLSVIIVGASIAVGIQMFNAQSYSANKNALAADAQSYATQVIQFYKSPIALGGAGQKGEHMGADAIGSYIGWALDDTANSNAKNQILTENGFFEVSGYDDANNIVTIKGWGSEVRNDFVPKVVTTITFPEGSITAVVSDVAKADIPSGGKTALYFY